MNSAIHTPRDTPAEQAGARPETRPQRASKEAVCEVLPVTAHGEWDELVDRSPYGTVFHHSWWLRSVAENFAILGVRNERGLLVSGMPVPLVRKHGLTLVQPPPLTPYLGPIFDLSNIHGTCDRLHAMRSHGETLAGTINDFDSFRCTAGPVVPDLQGFLWSGFQARLAYTHRFSGARSLDQVLAGMTEGQRYELRRALRTDLNVTLDDGVDDFIFVSRKHGKANRSEPAVSTERLGAIWNVARERGKAQLYVARTNHGVPIAALLTIADERTAYGLLCAVDPEHRGIPGLHLVVWNALQDAIVAGRDFELVSYGSLHDDRFATEWGASAAPIWCLEKMGSWRGGLFHAIAGLQTADAI